MLSSRLLTARLSRLYCGGKEEEQEEEQNTSGPHFNPILLIISVFEETNPIEVKCA